MGKDSSANKAFSNHLHNGVYLKFPNGNSISTIWCRGSYSDNHDYTTGDAIQDYKTLNDGSNNAEIYPFTDNQRLHKRIFQHFHANSDETVIGYVNITDWLWVLNQLAKDVRKE